MANRLLPFLIENRAVRGFAVEITEGIPELLGWRNYAPDVFRQLGHALAATPLLAADMPDQTRFNLQFQGAPAAPVAMLVTQIGRDADGTLALRGMAKAKADASGDFQQLLRGGTLACLLEPRQGGERYQALVEVLGEKLADALEIYFARSEQLPTVIKLGAASGKLAALMLQRLPERCSGDDWHHVYTLASTLGEDELLGADSETLLRRLFAEDAVRVFPQRRIALQCQCSHAQISAMLLGLGEAELQPVLQERGSVDVTCEFCGRDYSYRDVEVRQLFAAVGATADGHRIQ